MDATPITADNPVRTSSGDKKAPLIIALTGHPCVGKDSIGDVLLTQQGFMTIAFAELLRSEVAAAWRIDQRMLSDRPTKEWPIEALAVGMCSDAAFRLWCVDGGESLTELRSPRWVMQRWASFKRRFCPDYYSSIVERMILRLVQAGWNRIVVTDLRDPVEESMLRSLGAKVVRVHRPDLATLPLDTASHDSEQHHRIKADADIVNDGSLVALAEAAIECVQVLKVGAV